MALEQKSLTDAQIDRQDTVDNLCHRLLNCLARTYGDALEGQEVIGWNMEYISAIRKAAQEIIVDKLHLMTQMEFYPYIEE